MSTEENNEEKRPRFGRVSQAQPEQIASSMNASKAAMSEAADSIHALHVEADRARGILGFGRRILVPADEIHVVVGNGVHTARTATQSKVFGQAAGQPSIYWLNRLTQVIKLKTISFTVPLTGPTGNGIEALDSNKVSFRLWAHAVAQLNPQKAETAARRIGQDAKGLVRTITQVAMSELIEAAAKMELTDIIANRQSLARNAFDKVNQAMDELGYDLSVLTVTQLSGDAYTKLVHQAESRVSKETTIAINKEQLVEQEDIELRTQREAQIEAETRQKKAAIDATTTEKLVATERAKQKAMLEKVSLDRELEQAEAAKAAGLERKRAEYAAEIRALEQEKTNELAIAESEAEAARMALEQAKKIERDSELTKAEAGRLRQKEFAAAERSKEVALLKESEVAEAYRLQAEAEAQALAIKVEAETNADLAKAEVEAKATEQRARAAKIRAEATRAETAASGLAEVEVDDARLQVAERRVEVNRAEGLATAEIARAEAELEVERERKMREVDINAQKELADLYQKAPALMELEKARMAYDHEVKIAEINAKASLAAFEAIAPGIKVNLIGSGGQMGEVLTGIMSLSKGIVAIGDEIPAVGNLLNGSNGSLNGLLGNSGASLLPNLQTLTPSIQGLVKEMNPRVFSSLTLTDLFDRLGPVVEGQEDLISALDNVRQDANFRVVGDLPVKPLLGLLGIGNGSSNGVVEEDIAIN
ncbi:MAG: SPFH domain-containing protein [Chloroflexota bacterium]